MKIYFYGGIQIPWSNSELSFKQFHTESIHYKVLLKAMRMETKQNWFLQRASINEPEIQLSRKHTPNT